MHSKTYLGELFKVWTDRFNQIQSNAYSLVLDCLNKISIIKSKTTDCLAPIIKLITVSSSIKSKIW